MRHARDVVLSGYRKSVAVFVTLGAATVILAVALNIGWILLNWRTGLLLVLGVLFFLAIIAGVVLNTIFLVREIRRNEQQNNFLNAVTHELKTPIASLRLYIETLMSREIDPARRQEFYRTMLEDSDRLLYTVEQVLRAGQATKSKREIHKAPVNLADLAQDCIELALRRHHLEASAITLDAHIGPKEKPLVMGDLEELRIALSNMIDNAVKYSPGRSGIRVEVTRESHNTLALRVHDQGVGIPREELKRIFRRFYRIPGHVAARVKGTGLGLFIVRSVARRHGGKAFAESPGPGRGATVTMLLPIVKA